MNTKDPQIPSNATHKLDGDFLAIAQITAASIDREVASGRHLSDVLAVNYSGGQRIWAEMARPYSAAMAAS